MQGLAQFLEQGGTLMYVNLVVSIITLAFIVDRTIFFLGKGSVNAKAFLEQIRKLVLANNIDRAVKLCSATEAPVAQVARAGLQRVHRGEIAIAQAIEETLVDVTPDLKKRIGSLWSLANIATLITVLGGAAIAGGTVIYLTAPPPHHDATEHALYLAPTMARDGGGVVLGGAF